MLVLLYI